MTKSNRFVSPIYRNKPGKSFTLNVIVPAAGAGSKTRSYGSRSLFKLNDTQTLIDYQISSVKYVFPNSDIVVITGFDSNKLIRNAPSGIRLVENHLYETTNVVYSIYLGLLATIGSNVLIIYNDILFSPKDIELITSNGSCTLVFQMTDNNKKNVGVIINNGEIASFSYGINNVWGQITYLEGKEFELLKIISSNPNKKQLMFHEILNEIIDKGGRIKALEINRELIEVKSGRGLNENIN